MTDTIETNTDNSMNVETQEPDFAPGNTDNADTDNSEQVVNDKEPVETNGQFSDLAEANKAYAELRKLNGEQSTELGQLRKMRDEYQAQIEQQQAQALQQAQENGFNSIIEYENHTELVNFVADELEKNLSDCSYPDEVHNLIEQYRKTPNPDILKTIKNEFDVDTLERITLASAQKQQELQDRVYSEVENSARAFLDSDVNKYIDRFQNPAFAELYGEAFRAYGVNLQTDKFLQLLDNYTNSVLKSSQINNGIAQDNINATDEIAGLSSMGMDNTRNGGSDILKMSDSDMVKTINKYL